MKINILNIPEEGLNLHFSLKGDSLSGLIADKENLGFSLRGIEVAGSIKKAHRNIFFAGTLETVLETQCSRCLEDAHLPLKAEYSYTLLPEVEPAKEEIELRTEDLDVGYYSGEVIDLAPVIVEQIILQVPMKILCKESCKGLCPHCGMNRNVGTCDCRSDIIDERLAVLKTLKIS